MKTGKAKVLFCAFQFLVFAAPLLVALFTNFAYLMVQDTPFHITVIIVLGINIIHCLSSDTYRKITLLTCPDSVAAVTLVRE